MFAYISQKISLGNDRIITRISFDDTTELLAIGFESGGIKILKFHEKNSDSSEIELVMNENLKDSHEAPIETLSWNPQHGKLLSVDQQGLMIVWTESDDIFVEEMVNESDQNKILKAIWSKNGNFVLIVLQNGGAILGNVEGERLWHRKVDFEIQFAEFIEDDKTIILSDFKGELAALDTRSNETFAEYDISQEQIQNETIKSQNWRKQSTEVYNHQNSKDLAQDPQSKQNLIVFTGNNLQEDNSRLIAAYQSGDVYLINNLRECDMKKFAFGFRQICAGVWNKEGDGFALSVKVNNINAVYLFNKNATILTFYQVPNPVSQLDYCSYGISMLQGYQNNLYMSQIKKDYKYCYLQQKQVLVYYYPEQESIFYVNLQNQNIKKKVQKNFINFYSNQNDKIIVICNSVVFDGKQEAIIFDHCGNYIDQIVLKFKPNIIQISKNFSVFERNGHIIIWDFQNLQSLQESKLLNQTKKIFYMYLGDNNNIIDIYQNQNFQYDQNKIIEPCITAIDIQNTSLYICNEKGFTRKFSLLNFQEGNPIILNKIVKKILINKKESHIGILDIHKQLQVLSIDTKEIIEEQLDVWKFFWDDNSQDYVYVQKNKIYQKSLRNKKKLKENKTKKRQKVSEKFIKNDRFLLGISFPYIILYDLNEFVIMLQNFQMEKCQLDLLLKKIKLNKIKKIEKEIETSDNINFESLSQHFSIEDKKTLKFIASQFMLKNQYKEAEKAYRILKDYASLKFIQKLKNGVQNELYKQAQKYMFLKQPEKAIELIVDVKKENLLIQLLQEYHMYEEIAQYKHLIDNRVLEEVHNKLGQKNYRQKNLNEAIKNYEKVADYECLIPLYCESKQFEKLAVLCEKIKDKNQLRILAQHLLQYNMIEAAALIFEKLLEPKRSVDIAILHNFWGTAVEIAEKNNFQQVDNLLKKFAQILLEKNQKMEVVQLYRKAKKNLEAAKMLNQIAEDFIVKNNNALMVKKIFILSALEINLEKKKRFNPNITANLTNVTLSANTSNKTHNTLNTLITSDLNNASDKILANPWKGAEAWHLFLLTLQYLKQENYLNGFIVFQRLQNYELELGQERIYIIGSIFSKILNQFKIYSKCLSKLENYYKISKNNFNMRKIQTIILNTFAEQEPINENLNLEKVQCPQKNCQNKVTELDIYCNSCRAVYSTCMSSGRSVLTRDYYKCSVCKHKIIKEEIHNRNLKFCAFCHNEIKEKKSN